MKVKTLTTQKGQHLEITYEAGRKVLNTENANYSFGSLHRVFDNAFRSLQISEHHADNVLLLGLGAGSVIQLLRQTYGVNAAITAIELDEDIIDVAIHQFGIQKYADIQIICSDAANYLKICSHAYDLIIDDVYMDILMPEFTLQQSYLSDIKRLLNPGGMFIRNCMFENNGQQELFDGHCRAVFSAVTIIHAGKMNKVYACMA